VSNLEFTFGIVTSGTNDSMLESVIGSIRSQNMPSYEIVIVGNTSIRGDRIRVVPFNEGSKKGWITRKKNIVTREALFENVVYMHDYFGLEPGWYEGWKSFGNDFTACMNKIVNYDGARFRDWTLFPPHSNPSMPEIPPREVMLPYDIDTSKLNRFMYFSGGYWVAKRDIMLELPLDEKLVWGEGEDVLWSEQFRSKYRFSMNPNSSVKILKAGKDKAFEECTTKTVEYLKGFLK